MENQSKNTKYLIFPLLYYIFRWSWNDFHLLFMLDKARKQVKLVKMSWQFLLNCDVGRVMRSSSEWSQLSSSSSPLLNPAELLEKIVSNQRPSWKQRHTDAWLEDCKWILSEKHNLSDLSNYSFPPLWNYRQQLQTDTFSQTWKQKPKALTQCWLQNSAHLFLRDKAKWKQRVESYSE